MFCCKYKRIIEQLQHENKELERATQKSLKDYKKLKKRYEILKRKHKRIYEFYDSEQKASKIGGSIYWRFIGILLMFCLMSLFFYFKVSEEYRNIFITLIAILVTYCFEPFFKICTDKYEDEKLRANFDYILNTLKIVIFLVLAMLYGAIFWSLSLL